MELTKENFKTYAAHYYDNQSCISDEEFEQDLKQLKVIKRMMTRYVNGEESNLRLLVNNVIIFFNCFKVEGAVNLIEFSVDQPQHEYFNSLFAFISLPLIGNRKFNKKFFIDLSEEFK